MVNILEILHISGTVRYKATYPFDLTKTRLQIQSEVASAKHGYKLENLGMIKTAVGIAKQEGVLKLWTGLMPMFQRHAIYSGCRLILYEHFRDALKDEDGKMSLGAASIADLVTRKNQVVNH
ncbi:jg8583 [Pararge aegeria aegeria]|uniref:Jg8583 protein n=1 Tax=Pararge aegeria aegeria TaxID=348720 RepID=A0A8S4RL74_9NEOP|nr:jg8583 [Pararge aegeria aegeria]